MTCEPARPEHRAGLVALFEAAGCACYCRFWHFSGDDDAWDARSNLEPARSRAELERAIESRSPEALGVVALEATSVVGWLKLCPAAAMQKLMTRRPYRALPCLAGDRRDVYVVGCMLVHPAARRQGVSRALLEAALALARARGARAVEAIPRVPRDPVRDEELWTGPPSIFRACGFLPVGGPDAYPVLRREL